MKSNAYRNGGPLGQSTGFKLISQYIDCKCDKATTLNQFHYAYNRLTVNLTDKYQLQIRERFFLFSSSRNMECNFLICITY